jgi:GT2 family glycosyltransferase
MGKIGPSGVVAVAVTFRRLPELRRLIESLQNSTQPPIGCVIADHDPGHGTQDLARAVGIPLHIHEDSSNPGPGAGWANASTRAIEIFGDRAESILFLDDDVLLPPDGIATMTREAASVGADSIAPLLEDDTGELWGFPEPVDRAARKLIRQARTTADAARLLGPNPQAFCWCTGACQLVSRDLLQKTGPHRRDFWMLGEDLEFSMRAAAMGKAVFTTSVTVPHLPPKGNPQTAQLGGYLKFCSLLQNLSYLSFHSPYSRHMKSYLPGNYRRFFRTYGWSLQTMSDATTCLTGGMLAGQPAGLRIGHRLRERIRGRKSTS